MPSYVHTCDSCGAHMQVHERYLGRTLRCTSCRAEFTAELPADVEAEAAAEPPPEVELPERRGSRRFLWLALLLVPLAALVWWLGQDMERGVGGDLFRPQRGVGEMAVLERDGAAAVVVALDRAAAEELAAGDERTQTSVLESGHGLEIAGGTRVRVLERGGRGRELRVRILSGPWEGRIVWVPSRWVR